MFGLDTTGSIIAVTILGLIGVSIFARIAADPGKYICKNCGSQERTKSITRGSIAIEIVLWLLFILPGVIYSVWRLTTRRRGCRSCGGEVIDVNSPMGKKLVRELAA